MLQVEYRFDGLLSDGDSWDSDWCPKGNLVEKASLRVPCVGKSNGIMLGTNKTLAIRLCCFTRHLHINSEGEFESERVS